MYTLTGSLLVIVMLSLKFYFEMKLRNFWSSHGIKFGGLNIGNVVKMFCQLKSFASISNNLYEEYKRKSEDVVGINFANMPIAIVTSPDVAKLILHNDSHYFRNRGFYTGADPISTNLFTSGEDKTVGPNLRNKLHQAFHAIDHCKIHDIMNLYAATTFVTYLEPDAKFHRDIDVTDLLERYTTYLVGYNLMEIYCCPIWNPGTELRRIGLLLNTKKHRIKKLLSYLFPNLFDKYSIKTIDPAVGEYFIRKLSEIMELRARFCTGKSFFDEIFKSHDNNYGASRVELAACCAQILEASNAMATTMSYLLYELALNHDIQDELREEISTTYYRDNFTFRYDSISKMLYMDRVISETLRKYPPLSTLHRVAMYNYRLPNGGIIPKGVRIIIPTLGFHKDSEYFTNPNKFDPNRFADKPCPFTYMPFGEGYHRCIAVKFTVHQMKIVIAHLLRCYRFNVCDRTEKFVKCDSIGLWSVPKSGMWLNISKSR